LGFLIKERPKSALDKNCQYMAINSVKFFGWFLVAAGLALIVHSVTVSYDYFTAKAEFPALIKDIPEIGDASPTPQSSVDLANSQEVQAMMQEQIQNSVNETIGGLVPAGSLAKMLNAAIWSVFATFLVYAGAKISQIGVMMLAAKEKQPD
jgi:hypothetical protein